MQSEGIPSKKSRVTVPPTPSSVIVSTKLFGAGSFGNCYLASYRGIDVVSKELVVKKLKNETVGKPKCWVTKELAALKGPHYKETRGSSRCSFGLQSL